MARCESHHKHGLVYRCYSCEHPAECSCGGDTSKCDFFPEKRKQKGNDFDQYDHDLMAEARNLLIKVYEYHYGDPKMKSKINRLETIICKLGILQNM